MATSSTWSPIETIVAPVPYGAIVPIGELRSVLGDDIGPRSVRVVGYLASFDALAQRAVVTHAGSRVTVETSLLKEVDCPLDAAVMVIGEIESPRLALVIRARIFTAVEGLDFSTFFMAYTAARVQAGASEDRNDAGEE